MIHSMTAFAQCSVERDFGTLSWELYSLNHRYLEVSFKLPETHRALEPQLKERLATHLHRGKIHCQLNFQPSRASDYNLRLNQPLLQALALAHQQLFAVFNQPPSLSMTDLLNWPGVLQSPSKDHSLLHQAILELFDQTLHQLIQVRQQEGTALKTHLTTLLQTLSLEIMHIQTILPQLLLQQRTKLLTRIESLQIAVEPSRLEQELLFILQKSDIAEEIERLQIHLLEVQKTLQTKGAVGRRLDFLLQELHREANTLGAKSLDTSITHATVNLKVAIEQMREQVQNIQ